MPWWLSLTRPKMTFFIHSTFFANKSTLLSYLNSKASNVDSQIYRIIGYLLLSVIYVFHRPLLSAPFKLSVSAWYECFKPLRTFRLQQVIKQAAAFNKNRIRNHFHFGDIRRRAYRPACKYRWQLITVTMNHCLQLNASRPRWLRGRFCIQRLSACHNEDLEGVLKMLHKSC